MKARRGVTLVEVMLAGGIMVLASLAIDANGTAPRMRITFAGNAETSPFAGSNAASGTGGDPCLSAR